MLKRIEASDGFQIIGLSMSGVGLYFCFGAGWALIGSGVLFLGIGFFGHKKG